MCATILFLVHIVLQYYRAMKPLATTMVFLLFASAAKSDGFIESFDDAGFRNRWFFSNFDQQGDWFQTSWRRNLVSLVLRPTPAPGGGALHLKLQSTTNGEKPYFGSEVQRGGPHHFGSYEVIMRPARGNGIVSAFFLYTGPYFGDPHDEIDFEFLGQDTKKVWINKFASGERMPGKWIDLPFDAANRQAVYRIEWRSDSITWFVDDVELHKITSETHQIPQTPSKIFVNIWAGNEKQEEWLGLPDEEIDAEMQVYCVSYRPIGDPGLTCSEYGAGRW